MITNGFFGSIGNFLFSRANREFLLFLFFLALAGIFWLMMTLNETYEQEIRICVRYSNVPKNVVLTSGETDTMRVVVSDKGFNILTYLYGQSHKPVEADFTRHATAAGTGSVSNSELRKLAASELPASAKIGSVKPEKLVFHYNFGESKRVPVRWRGQVTPQQLYFIAQTTCSPDSVTVYASKNMLDSIRVAYTEPLNCSDIHDTLTVDTRLTPIEGAKIVPDEVALTFITDVLAEVQIEGVAIEGVNMPKGKVLRTFPAKVKVKFVTGVKNYQTLKPSDFRVIADYEELSRGNSSQCSISIDRMPSGISNAKLETNKVDYLIEEVAQ